MKTIIWKGCLYLFAAALAAFFITHFVGMRVLVNGRSMEPVLYNGESLILDRLTYRFSDPERFDIVVIPGVDTGNGEEKSYFVKRIVGLPGEQIQIKEGLVYINDRPLKEDHYGKDAYISNPGMLEEAYTLSEDEYFLLGDNREVSLDSRNPLLGPVRRKDITGRVIFRIWPPGRWGRPDA